MVSKQIPDAFLVEHAFEHPFNAAYKWKNKIKNFMIWTRVKNCAVDVAESHG